MIVTVIAVQLIDFVIQAESAFADSVGTAACHCAQIAVISLIFRHAVIAQTYIYTKHLDAAYGASKVQNTDGITGSIGQRILPNSFTGGCFSEFSRNNHVMCTPLDFVSASSRSPGTYQSACAPPSSPVSFRSLQGRRSRWRCRRGGGPQSCTAGSDRWLH